MANYKIVWLDEGEIYPLLQVQDAWVKPWIHQSWMLSVYYASLQTSLSHLSSSQAKKSLPSVTILRLFVSWCIRRWFSTAYMLSRIENISCYNLQLSIVYHNWIPWLRRLVASFSVPSSEFSSGQPSLSMWRAKKQSGKFYSSFTFTYTVIPTFVHLSQVKYINWRH
jgi:hypothetical protein